MHCHDQGISSGSYHALRAELGGTEFHSLTHSFVHSTNQPQIFTTCFVPEPALRAGNTDLNMIQKKKKNPCLHTSYILVEKVETN